MVALNYSQNNFSIYTDVSAAHSCRFWPSSSGPWAPSHIQRGCAGWRDSGTVYCLLAPLAAKPRVARETFGSLGEWAAAVPDAFCCSSAAMACSKTQPRLVVQYGACPEAQKL